MSPSSPKGNDPERWEKLLHTLDEKLQLGLLDHLERVASYHFENETLFIQPGSTADFEYLSKPAFFQQLQVLAQDSIGVESVKLNSEAQ
jgi:hypothetical protein